jgi:hypothetical protein
VVFNACVDEASGVLFLLGGEFAFGGFEFAEDDSPRWHRGGDEDKVGESVAV